MNYHTKVLLLFCDNQESPLSTDEDDEYSGFGKLISLKCVLLEWDDIELPYSDSELFKCREFLLESILSKKEGYMRSILGLSLLTIDISISGERSYDLSIECLPLLDGNLCHNF